MLGRLCCPVRGGRSTLCQSSSRNTSHSGQVASRTNIRDERSEVRNSASEFAFVASFLRWGSGERQGGRVLNFSYLGAPQNGLFGGLFAAHCAPHRGSSRAASWLLLGFFCDVQCAEKSRVSSGNIRTKYESSETEAEKELSASAARRLQDGSFSASFQLIRQGSLDQC